MTMASCCQLGRNSGIMMALPTLAHAVHLEDSGPLQQGHQDGARQEDDAVPLDTEVLHKLFLLISATLSQTKRAKSSQRNSLRGRKQSV